MSGVKDVDEIEQWFRQYSSDVKTFLVYFLRRTDVDDLVQETFIRAMRGQDKYRRHASPKTWLLTIARNLAVDETRRAKHQQPAQIMSDFPDSHPTPEDAAVLNDEMRIVMAVLLDLPQPQREVVLLRTMMGMSVSETANILGWTKTRVGVTFHRSLKALRTKLNTDEGGGFHEIERA